jgi:HEAT repeat protein
VALRRFATKTDAPRLLAVARDPAFRSARGEVVQALVRLKVPETGAVARTLLADSNVLVVVAAVRSLGRLRQVDALESLRAMNEHSHKAVRTAVARALAKIEGVGTTSTLSAG